MGSFCNFHVFKFESAYPGVHNFYKMVKRAGVSGCCFHDLRHTFASLTLMRGAKPKVISEALGHSAVAFTMDVYSHIIDGMQEDAMTLLDEVLPAGVSQSSNGNLTPIINITSLKTYILALAPVA
jgi:integrase